MCLSRADPRPPFCCTCLLRFLSPSLRSPSFRLGLFQPRGGVYRGSDERHGRQHHGGGERARPKKESSAHHISGELVLLVSIAAGYSLQKHSSSIFPHHASGKLIPHYTRKLARSYPSARVSCSPTMLQRQPEAYHNCEGYWGANEPVVSCVTQEDDYAPPPTAPLPSTKKTHTHTQKLRLVWEARDGLAKRRETRDYKTAKFVEACFEAAPQVSESDDACQSSTMYLVYYNTPLSFSQSLAAYYFLATREGPKAFRPSAMVRAWLSDLSCCPRKAPPPRVHNYGEFSRLLCVLRRGRKNTPTLSSSCRLRPIVFVFVTRCIWLAGLHSDRVLPAALLSDAACDRNDKKAKNRSRQRGEKGLGGGRVDRRYTTYPSCPVWNWLI